MFDGVRLVLTWLLWLSGAGLVLAAPAAAEPVELVERGCRIATDRSADIAELLARPAGAPCPELPPKRAADTVWIDYPATADLMPDSTRLWRVLIDGTRVRTIDLYVVRENGAIEHSHYDPFAADRQWSPGGYLSLTVEPNQARVARMLIRFGGVEDLSLVRSIQLVRWRESVTTERRNAALFGAAVGILGITILFHLSLFFAIRRRFQLLYCLNVAMMFGFGLVYSGVAQLIVPISGPGVVRLISAFLTAACATGLAFMIDFVERRAIPEWLRRWTLATVALTVPIAIANIVTPMAWTRSVATLSQLAGTHGLLLVSVLLGVAIWRGSRTARLLAIGWSVPVGVAALIPLRASGLVGHFAIPDGALLYVLTLECIILSLPVTERIRALRIDHERARERQHILERQARTDALTGLANRHGFDNAVRSIFSGEGQAALLLIDIDHFKAVNDAHGHGHGDMMLRRVADHVARTAGDGAIVARFGGEEFVVALRGYDAKRASTIAERIRIGMETLCQDIVGADPVTLSIGVACGPSDAIDSLIDEADRALYQAKRRGRDCVVIGHGAVAAAA